MSEQACRIRGFGLPYLTVSSDVWIERSDCRYDAVDGRQLRHRDVIDGLDEDWRVVVDVLDGDEDVDGTVARRAAAVNGHHLVVVAVTLLAVDVRPEHQPQVLAAILFLAHLQQ